MFVHALTHEAWWELVVGWPLPEMTQASVLIGLPSMAGSPVEILDTVTYLIRISSWQLVCAAELSCHALCQPMRCWYHGLRTASWLSGPERAGGFQVYLLWYFTADE